MKSTRILYLLSIILSIVNLFVVYTTFLLTYLMVPRSHYGIGQVPLLLS